MRDSKLLLVVVVESIAPALPPELREISILNDPKEENLRNAQFTAEQKKSIFTAEKKVQPVLDWASDLLCKAGLAAEVIETTVCYPADGLAATGEILETAREHKCQTIVMGREPLSWLGKLIQADPAEELVRLGNGFTIWIVNKVDHADIAPK